MNLHFTEQFLTDLEKLEPGKKTRVVEALLALPAAFRSPHQHSGLGVRKIHNAGVWECRAGLGLRVLFVIKANTVFVETVGSHDDVQKYLRRL